MAIVDHEVIDFLVERAREGDKEAFSKLVRMMMKDIVALTYQMTQDRESAFDLAQDTFVSAWENLRGFRGESMFQSWLYRIASNKTLNFLKQRSRRQAMSIDSEPVGAVASQVPSDNPEQSLREAELQKGVLDFMGGLPAQQRLVFDLRFYKGLTFEEITRVTGKALGTVKTHYREAVIKLRTFAEQRGWRS
jgi:RNA polymerase sigma-70 factor (ECF subfamily)